MRAFVDRLKRPGAAIAEEVVGIRQRVDKHRERLDQQRDRLDQQRTRLDRQVDKLDRLRDRVLKLRDQMAGQQRTLAELKQTLGPVQREARQREVDYLRAMHQISALEARVGRIEERLEGDSYTTDDSSLVEARSLVDTVRREHDQVRVRFQLITQYEERMRRLEAAVTELYDGDMRHSI